MDHNVSGYADANDVGFWMLDDSDGDGDGLRGSDSDADFIDFNESYSDSNNGDAYPGAQSQV